MCRSTVSSRFACKLPVDWPFALSDSAALIDTLLSQGHASVGRRVGDEVWSDVQHLED